MFLSRIDQRLRELGLSENEASRLAGRSRDAIRNWRRAANDPHRRLNPTREALESVAAVLGVTPEWLLRGDGAQGMAEPEAVPFVGRTPAAGSMAGRQDLPERALVAYRVTRAAPGLAILRGDVIFIDIRSAAREGDLVVATLSHQADDRQVTVLRRYLPPWLVSGAADGDAPERLDNTGRAAVLGVIRAVERTVGGEG